MMYVVSFLDRSKCLVGQTPEMKRRQLAALTLLVSGCAIFVFPTVGPGLGLVALSVAVSGFISVQPLFWTFPSAYLADVAAAGGIALIGMGNLGGFSLRI
jgi:hypothetical protein